MIELIDRSPSAVLILFSRASMLGSRRRLIGASRFSATAIRYYQQLPKSNRSKFRFNFGSKFNQTGTQAILYFNSFAVGEMVQVKFRLRAKYPIRARTFQSRVYEYYDPATMSMKPQRRTLRIVG